MNISFESPFCRKESLFIADFTNKFVNKKRIEESYLGGSVKSSVANRNDSINPNP